MAFHARRIALVALAFTVGLCGCTQAGATQATHTSTSGAASVRRASVRPASYRPMSTADRVTSAARSLYAEQVGGAHSVAVLQRLAGDPQLLKLIRSNDAAARAYVARQYPLVWYHWHVSRMRITRGSQTVTELGVRFVMPGPSTVLAGTGGARLQISMQDEIGFVRLMRRRYGVDVVIRGRGAKHLRASMRAAGLAHLPATGSVTLGGRRYQVRSFHEHAWNGEPVTIWILVSG